MIKGLKGSHETADAGDANDALVSAGVEIDTFSDALSAHLSGTPRASTPQGETTSRDTSDNSRAQVSDTSRAQMSDTSPAKLSDTPHAKIEVPVVMPARVAAAQNVADKLAVEPARGVDKTASHTRALSARPNASSSTTRTVHRWARSLQRTMQRVWPTTAKRSRELRRP